MRVYLYLVSAVFFIQLFIGCKKYEEGPLISLRGKKSRITNEWKLEKQIENKTGESKQFSEVIWDIRRDNSIIQTSSGNTYKSEWSFNGSKEELIVTYNPTGSSTVWEIIKLKTNSLWVKGEFYELHFVKK